MANNQNFDDQDTMSREESGQLGGETTRDRYGEDYYEEIGSKGGRKRSENQDQQDSERGNQQDDDSRMEDTF